MAALTGQAIPADRARQATGRLIFRSPSAHSPAITAASNFVPTRLTPSHQWAHEQGAEFVETGAWLRAQYFPRRARRIGSRPSRAKYARCARQSDSAMSPRLGKIEVHGPDAGAFLDRLYINTFSNLPVGTRALWADVARRRHRLRRRDDVAPGRRPLFHDHDDGERRARVCAHAVLPSGAVAGTRCSVRFCDR